MFDAIGLPLAIILFWTASLHRLPHYARGLYGVTGIALLALFVQSMERLFFPVRAARRSLAWSERSRWWLGLAGVPLGWTIWGLSVVAALLSVSNVISSRAIYALVCLISLRAAVQRVFTDLLGVKVDGHELDAEILPKPTVSEMKPLQSEAWGDAGTSHAGS
jgi:hypothetical protein